jgi:hypothetical protein
VKIKELVNSSKGKKGAQELKKGGRGARKLPRNQTRSVTVSFIFVTENY